MVVVRPTGLEPGASYSGVRRGLFPGFLTPKPLYAICPSHFMRSPVVSEYIQTRESNHL